MAREMQQLGFYITNCSGGILIADTVRYYFFLYLYELQVNILSRAFYNPQGLRLNYWTQLP